MDSQNEHIALRQQLREYSSPERAIKEKSYLKSDLEHYGVKVPDLRKIAKIWTKDHADLPMPELASFAEVLWDSGWHEERSLAIMLLDYRGKALSLAQMPIIERMIHEAQTWAHLDEIAVSLVGGLIDTDAATLAYLPCWAESDNFWVRRTAILAQNRQFRRGDGDVDLFMRLAVPMLAEGADWSQAERFFIRKAIGWTLRELCKHWPDTVFEFVQRYRDQMSGLTLREATRKLPETLRNQL
jgi:3-methyladenine DNA glycosylase AlkD